jgi:hypothetical protein
MPKTDPSHFRAAALLGPIVARGGQGEESWQFHVVRVVRFQKIHPRLRDESSGSNGPGISVSTKYGIETPSEDLLPPHP